MPGFEKVGIEEKNAVINVFEKNNGVLFAHGFDKMRNGNYEVRNLEKKAKEYFGSKYCLYRSRVTEYGGPPVFPGTIGKMAVINRPLSFNRLLQLVLQSSLIPGSKAQKKV